MDNHIAYLASLLQGIQDPGQGQGQVSPQATNTPALAPPQAAPATAPQSQPMVSPLQGNPVQQPQVPVVPVPHQGAFGIHGTARAILGTLGDAFLVQGGHAPVYAQHVQQEKESEAMQGFANNPLEAIQRLSTVNPEAAQKAYGEYVTQTRVNRMADEQYTQTVANRALSMLGAATKENYPQIKSQIAGYVASRGVNLPFQLPDAYDADAIDGLQRGGMTPEQQHQAAATDAWRDSQMGYRYSNLAERAGFHKGELAQGTQRTGIMQQNADTAGQNADTREAGEAETVRDHGVREGQGQQIIDQVTSGDRGVPMRLRPRPGSLVKRVGPDGRTVYGRVLAVDANGNPTKIGPAY